MPNCFLSIAFIADLLNNLAASFQRFGYSVSLSTNGSTLAIGVYGSDSNGYDSGEVQVYQWNEATLNYEQLGQPILGEAPEDYAGRSISLSGDGTTIAIGSPRNDVNGNNSGQVRVFGLVGSTSWRQLGSSINGDAGGDRSGQAVAISSDGNTLVVGSTFHTEKTGQVRVYRWDKLRSNYDQIGEDINGQATNDEFGGSVAVSSNGQIIAIGASQRNHVLGTGYVKTFALDESVLNYRQIGLVITGNIAGDKFGDQLSLSSNGMTLAIGAWGNVDLGYGYVNVYQRDGLNWNQIGKSLSDVLVDGYDGDSVALSSDGKSLAIGATFDGNSGSGTPIVRVVKVGS